MAKTRAKNLMQTARVLFLPPDRIHANPSQPRRRFDPAELQELALSIRQYGVLQPLSVRRLTEDYELVAGERRLRAAALAGLKTVPCILLELDEAQSGLVALVENLQRRDLNYFEQAEGIARLIRRYGLSQEQVAVKLGKSQSAVANKLRLLQLSPAVQKQLCEHGLSERHARALLRLPEEAQRLSVIEQAAQKQLSVARTEALVARLLTTPAPRKPCLPALGKDLRLFFNAMDHNLQLIRSAGFAAETQRQETEQEIVLTIRIPRCRIDGRVSKN